LLAFGGKEFGMVQRFTLRQATSADAAAVSGVLRASYTQLLKTTY
jgi:hypothetical protein